MFSPAAHAARQKVFRHIIRTPARTTLDGNGPAEPDEPELLDPDTLQGADQCAFYDLKDYEDRYDVLMSTEFDYSSLHFTQQPHPANGLFSLDANQIMKSLLPAHHATEKWSYRQNALRIILGYVRATECIHPGLVIQREALIAVLATELDDSVQRTLKEWNERRNRQTKAHNLRIIECNVQFRAYASPLTLSILVLAAIVHCLMGVARESCNFILSSLKAILSLAADMQGACAQRFTQQNLRNAPNTLSTMLHFLNLPPPLQRYVTCPRCSCLYKEHNHSQVPQTCTARNHDGIICGAPLFGDQYKGGKVRRRAIRRYTHQLFSTWLSDILLRPGVEDMLESVDPSPKTVMNDVWDGNYWHSFPESCFDNFLDAPSSAELRICMLLYHDFFNPFRNKTAGKLRSVGCFFMVCLNLPPHLRYDTSFAYLASIVPGPSEPSMEELQHFIRPLADEMLEFYDPGVWIARTHKYPEGRKVRVSVPLNCMDTVAARAFGGFATHGHTCFCYLCSATLDRITENSLEPFQLRTMDAHRAQAYQWANAPTLHLQKKLFEKNGVCNSEWLRFEWWNAFEGSVIGPLHWIRNILDKQLRQNMNWSWTLPTGIPQLPSLARPISKLEYNWGQRALYFLDRSSFEAYKLPEPLVRYLCRQRNIYEAGLSMRRLMAELNQWRLASGIIDANGQVIDLPSSVDIPVSVAKAHYYLSKANQPSTLQSQASAPDLRYLCDLFGLSSTGPKSELAPRLIKYYTNVRVHDLPETSGFSKAKKETVAVLGVDILTEVRNDMGRTTLPWWIKLPPKNFATVNHGKLQSEEYKSLALVSFVITLVRLWGTKLDGPFRERLDNFLHLMLAVRILSFQSLVESDIVAFECHYTKYLQSVSSLYPHASRNPTQHLGLHIPAFLRALGPSTRLSESTCEMFIGILQDISTNFKFGDLEMTLHREFVMASRLKGMIEQDSFTDGLGAFGDLARQFVAGKLPGKVGQGWKTAREAAPTTLDCDRLAILNSWADSQGGHNPSRQIYNCSSIQQGNLLYAPYTHSAGDSCVLFSCSLVDGPCPGRIDAILEDAEHSRILLLLRAFVPLSASDSAHDPYWNHPLIGYDSASIARLYYDDVSSKTLVIEPRNLISHVAVCNFHSNRIRKPCVVVLSLDLKHWRYT